MNYFSLELIDGADTSLNFLSEPRFVTLIKSWQMQFVIIQKVQLVGALQNIFLVAHLPLILSLKQLTSRNKEIAALHYDSSYSLGIHQKHFSSFRKKCSSDRQSGTKCAYTHTMSQELDCKNMRPQTVS